MDVQTVFTFPTERYVPGYVMAVDGQREWMRERHQARQVSDRVCLIILSGRI